MPQEFVLLQCFSCQMYQVHIRNKTKKFNCKVCGEKQSYRHIFAISNQAKDLRLLCGEYQRKRIEGEEQQIQSFVNHSLEHQNEYEMIEANNQDNNQLNECNQLEQSNEKKQSRWDQFDTYEEKEEGDLFQNVPKFQLKMFSEKKKRETKPKRSKSSIKEIITENDNENDYNEKKSFQKTVKRKESEKKSFSTSKVKEHKESKSIPEEEIEDNEENDQEEIQFNYANNFGFSQPSKFRQLSHETKKSNSQQKENENDDLDMDIDDIMALFDEHDKQEEMKHKEHQKQQQKEKEKIKSFEIKQPQQPKSIKQTIQTESKEKKQSKISSVFALLKEKEKEDSNEEDLFLFGGQSDDRFGGIEQKKTENKKKSIWDDF